MNPITLAEFDEMSEKYSLNEEFRLRLRIALQERDGWETVAKAYEIAAHQTFGKNNVEPQKDDPNWDW
jgi:hypothetical protein